MSGENELSLREKLTFSKNFSLQIDKFAGNAQRIANIRSVDSDSITDNSLCKGLPERTTGSVIFCVADEYVCKNGQHWQDC
jgi:hypothetical protein